MDCKSSPDRDLGEEMARLHCLQALFPEWTGQDMFLLKQLKEAIEISFQQGASSDTFENFSRTAADLREQTPGKLPASHAFISLDFSGKTWDPLFAREEIIHHLKRNAGTDDIFLLIRGLRRALFPAARYRTKARDKAHLEATRFIDELTRKWSTRSSNVHLLYL